MGWGQWHEGNTFDASHLATSSQMNTANAIVVSWRNSTFR
jgi:hypothetical protein